MYIVSPNPKAELPICKQQHHRYAQKIPHPVPHTIIIHISSNRENASNLTLRLRQ